MGCGEQELTWERGKWNSWDDREGHRPQEESGAWLPCTEGPDDWSSVNTLRALLLCVFKLEDRMPK